VAESGQLQVDVEGGVCSYVWAPGAWDCNCGNNSAKLCVMGHADCVQLCNWVCITLGARDIAGKLRPWS
jgi:hypothetical protein